MVLYLVKAANPYCRRASSVKKREIIQLFENRLDFVARCEASENRSFCDFSFANSDIWVLDLRYQTFSTFSKSFTWSH